ncbi:MAG: hypothetical protein CVU23_13160, partial [Betaproteobacteria bacterium HGW-Betaproteobacteria-17]
MAARAIGALGVLLVVAGCAGLERKPDLQRLYVSSQSSVDQPPVILIPGIMGSRLLDDAGDGDERWVGSLFKTFFSNYRDLALPIDADTLMPTPNLTLGGLTDEVSGRDYYASITRILREAGGYRRGQPGVAAEPGHRYYYEFAYDWRL